MEPPAGEDFFFAGRRYVEITETQKTGLKVLLKVLIRLLKAPLKVLLKILTRLNQQILNMLYRALSPTSCFLQ